MLVLLNKSQKHFLFYLTLIGKFKICNNVIMVRISMSGKKYIYTSDDNLKKVATQHDNFNLRIVKIISSTVCFKTHKVYVDITKSNTKIILFNVYWEMYNL